MNTYKLKIKEAIEEMILDPKEVAIALLDYITDSELKELSKWNDWNSVLGIIEEDQDEYL